jgi:zinc protease
MNSTRLTTAAAALAFAFAAPVALPAQAADTTVKPPPAAPLRPWSVPKVQTFSLDNGVRVLLAERHTLPVVTARVMVDAGAMRETASQNGVAALTASLLSEGAGDLSGSEIARRMESLGAQFATGGTYSLVFADLTAMKTVFPEAMMLAARTITAPSFPETEVTRLRAEMIANYEQNRARAEGIANDVFYRAAFEPSAPMSRPPQGTKATLSALTRDDVLQWHRAMYAPSATTVLLVGDLTQAEARQLLQRAFGSWKATRTAPSATPASAPATLGRTRIVLVDRPGSVQSGVVIGRGGYLASDPDYLQLLALNHVLGGAVSSRLNSNLREKHGWTYGAFSGLDLRRGGGAITISSAVRTDATDSAVTAALDEYRRLSAEPIPQAEFTGAINNLVSGFPATVQTVQALRGRLQGLVVWDLPLDYYGTYRERLTALTPSQVQQTAARRLPANDIVVVVAGDLSKIEQPIRARNLGTVEVWDADGKPVR